MMEGWWCWWCGLCCFVVEEGIAQSACDHIALISASGLLGFCVMGGMAVVVVYVYIYIHIYIIMFS